MIKVKIKKMPINANIFGKFFKAHQSMVWWAVAIKNDFDSDWFPEAIDWRNVAEPYLLLFVIIGANVS